MKCVLIAWKLCFPTANTAWASRISFPVYNRSNSSRRPARTARFSKSCAHISHTHLIILLVFFPAICPRLDQIPVGISALCVMMNSNAVLWWCGFTEANGLGGGELAGVETGARKLIILKVLFAAFTIKAYLDISYSVTPFFSSLLLNYT